MRVCIIGGGATGVMCAIQIKKKNPNINVTILEQNDRILKKVLKTGNGKCNICNNNINSSYYNDFSLIEKNNDFSVIDELFDLGLVLKETTLGRIYPYSESSKIVVNILLKNLEKYHVQINTNYQVTNISKNNGKYIINDEIICDALVIATGSCAQENTNGYELVKDLGHNITKLIPALVPIKVKEKVNHLQGLRVKCDAYVNNKKLNGEILFKNDGLSGILSLDISRLVKLNDVITLDLMPEYSEEKITRILENSDLDGIFPKMLASEILARSNKNISYTIKHFNFTVNGFYDFNEAQIVKGGVCLNEIDNYESKLNDNLYIGGEILDIDGASGGYNLYFAWLSGIVIANRIINK